MLAVALTILATVSTPANVKVGTAVANYLRPVLDSVGGAARVYYAAVCPAGQDELHSPTVIAHPAQPGVTGMVAARQIFGDDPEVTVTQDRSEMLRIVVGSVSPTVLQTKLQALSLDPYEQYSAPSAVAAIAAATDTHAREGGLPFRLALTTVDIIVSGPIPGVPHLPSLMRNITVDEALDSVATTFKGIVLYGECKQPDGRELFIVNYIPDS